MVERDSEGLRVCVCVVHCVWRGSKINQVCEDRCHQMGYLSQLFGPLLDHHYQACCLSPREGKKLIPEPVYVGLATACKTLL